MGLSGADLDKIKEVSEEVTTRLLNASNSYDRKVFLLNSAVNDVISTGYFSWGVRDNELLEFAYNENIPFAVKNLKFIGYLMDVQWDLGKKFLCKYIDVDLSTYTSMTPVQFFSRQEIINKIYGNVIDGIYMYSKNVQNGLSSSSLVKTFSASRPELATVPNGNKIILTKARSIFESQAIGAARVASRLLDGSELEIPTLQYHYEYNVTKIAGGISFKNAKIASGYHTQYSGSNFSIWYIPVTE